MSRYIDAEQAVKHIEEMTLENERMQSNFSANWTIDFLEAFPTADVELVKHAHWVRGEDVDGTFYLCSVCGEELPRVCIKPSTIDQPYGVFENTNFTKRCPNCGAKMDEREMEK